MADIRVSENNVEEDTAPEIELEDSDIEVEDKPEIAGLCGCSSYSEVECAIP